MLLSIYNTNSLKKIVHLLIAVALLIACNGMFTLVEAATKSLMCVPIRLIFTEHQRAIAARVINQGDEPVTYSIALVTMRKGPDGRLYEPEQETEEELQTKKIIRYSPRRATIEAKQSQTVKLMVRKPKDLPPGEYRTYLQLRPHPRASRKLKNELQDKDNFGVNVEVVVNSTFPIIIQHKLPMGKVTPEALQLGKITNEQNPLQVILTLSREGEASAFGNIFLDYLPEEGQTADSIEVGEVKGFAFYAPAKKKELPITLKTDISLETLKRGKLRATFQPSTGKFNRRQKVSNQRIVKYFSL